MFKNSEEESVDRSFEAWNHYLDWAVNSVKNTKLKNKSMTNQKDEDVCYDLTNLTLNPNEICCLFERAITVHCLQADIWLKFADYLVSMRWFS